MPLEEGLSLVPNTVVLLEEIWVAGRIPVTGRDIPHARSETARRYRFEDGIGEIELSRRSTSFCGHCSRIRITSMEICTCLFWRGSRSYGRCAEAPRRREGIICGVVQKKKSAITLANLISALLENYGHIGDSRRRCGSR
jgi:molybdenum cofactor biosynthesis enzyme MoaA